MRGERVKKKSLPKCSIVVVRQGGPCVECMVNCDRIDKAVWVSGRQLTSCVTVFSPCTHDFGTGFWLRFRSLRVKAQGGADDVGL